MKCKKVYVVFSPRTIFGIYEDKESALHQFGDLFELVDDLRIVDEVVIPELPF